MRIPFFAAFFSFALLPFATARSLQQHLQVYLYPAPQSSPTYQQSTPPTLSYTQAKAVIDHHLRQDSSAFDEVPEDESVWAHLLGLWDSRETSKARIVVVDGGVEAQDILPSSLPSKPSFYLDDNVHSQHLLAPYVYRAKKTFKFIGDALPVLSKPIKDMFDLAGTKAAEILFEELSCLSALADSLPWADRANEHPWDAVAITGLKDTQRGSDLWETGRKTVQAGLESMTGSDSPPLLLIIRPSSSKVLLPRAVMTSSLQGRRSLASQTCYSSDEACSEATNCNDRGKCAIKSAEGDLECWACKCRNGYIGEECQKEDYSTSFIILVFSTVLLLALTGGSIALLSTIGETKLPSTLNLAVSGGIKHN
ncbi:uncharacterized protein IAS62_003540 [Cryptococcus decagattii]|uniref:Vacuolar sorting protein Vps3844 C-terminal domain-containing protein n=1 Tax=Cryptococcus decagattii TaxID=1859122 RepID=A0ABZ2AUK9_9TREE